MVENGMDYITLPMTSIKFEMRAFFVAAWID